MPGLTLAESLTIVGWLLVALGAVSYLGGLVYTFRAARQSLPQIDEVFTEAAGDVRVLARPRADGPSVAGVETEGVDVSKLIEVLSKVLENVPKILEAFGRLALGIQWALLGLAAIGLGAYLLNM